MSSYFTQMNEEMLVEVKERMKMNRWTEEDERSVRK